LNLKSCLLALAGLISAGQASAADYPLLDGRCDEYQSIGAEVVAEGDRIKVLLFQDADYVWFCYALPEESYGTLDLLVDSPGLAEPINLHVSAQLGEWRAGHPDEAPQDSDSDLWWSIQGWWSNAVSFNGMRESDEGPRLNFQHSEGRELQMSKERFGRGTWRLRFSIGNVQDVDGAMKQIDLPSEIGKRIDVQVF